MIIKPAKRTESVKEYYFSRKNREMAAMNVIRKEAGHDPIINLGIGAPDGMPPKVAIDTLVSEAIKPGVHAYQSYMGIPELREAFASWYSRYYRVELDPSKEIQPLTGSKEGILLISLAFLNPGDKVLVPDPGYPTYSSSSRIVEAEIVPYDLLEENGWHPDFDALERMNLDGVKLMWTNYPGMPTGGKATRELYTRLVDFGRRHKILIVNDNPYSFILNDDPLSILEVEGAKDCCLELNSLSKAHNMSGWRIGMVAGDAQLVSQVLKVKSQMDSGMFKPLQLAAVEALSQGEEWFRSLNAVYASRKSAAAAVFDTLGVRYNPDSQGLFLWGKVEEGNPYAAGDAVSEGSLSLGERVSDTVLCKAGVFITPGFIFGRNGRDYVRISLCASEQTLRRANELIQTI